MKNDSVEYSLFHSSLGWCAISWSGAKVTSIDLPDANKQATRVRVLRRFPRAKEALLPPVHRRAAEALVGALNGRPANLAGLALDFEGVSPFHRRVYEVARMIPWGTVVSYGGLAALTGSPRAARAVGQAMQRNPFPIVVPCHRVLASDRSLRGFSAHGGLETKRRLLALEGVDPLTADLSPRLGAGGRRRGGSAVSSVRR